MEPPPLPPLDSKNESKEENPRPRKRKRKSRFDDKPPDAPPDGLGQLGLLVPPSLPLSSSSPMPPMPSMAHLDGLDAADRAAAIAAKLSSTVLLHRNTWPTSDGSQHRAEFREKVIVPYSIISDPEINFIGLMLGPRGQTQKRMEAETGTKITIRGRGSSKDGHGPEEDEDLYVQIIGDSDAKVKEAAARVNEIIHDKSIRDRLKQEQMKTVAVNNAPTYSHKMQHNLDTLYSSRSVTTSFDMGGRGGGSTTEIISIPADKVGIVIGRRGDTIKAIQEQSGAFLQVEREHNPEHPSTREVKIQGSPDQIESAKQEIAKYIGHRGRMADGNDHIMVPNNVVGLIIGKAGETIKFLQETTSCTIQVTPDSQSEPGQDRRINLSGSKEECDAAKVEIQKLVEQHKGNRFAPANVGGEEEVMIVPSNCAGVLIGKGGDNVKSMAAKTGTRIQVQRQAVGDFREVTIRGDRQNIEYAKSEIQKIIDTHSMNQGYGAGAGAGTGAGGAGAAWGAAYGYNMWQGYDPTQAGLDPNFDYAQYYQQYAQAAAAQQQQQQQQPQPPQPPQPPPGLPGTAATGMTAQQQGALMPNQQQAAMMHRGGGHQMQQGYHPHAQPSYPPQPPPPSNAHPPEPQGPPPMSKQPPPPPRAQPPPPPGQYPPRHHHHQQQRYG